MKTALVLSAGGMFGAYQAGVWQALQPVFRPDLVVGCSVGSINGWAIAAGISGEELVRTWLDPRCAKLMSPRRPRRPLFDPEPLEQMIQELTATYRPQAPFARERDWIESGKSGHRFINTLFSFRRRRPGGRGFAVR